MLPKVFHFEALITAIQGNSCRWSQHLEKINMVLMLYDQVSQQTTFQLFLNVCEKNEIFADTNYGYVIGYLYILAKVALTMQVFWAQGQHWESRLWDVAGQQQNSWLTDSRPPKVVIRVPLNSCSQRNALEPTRISEMNKIIKLFKHHTDMICAFIWESSALQISNIY